MGIFDIFKKTKSNTKEIEENYISDIEYKGINIEIETNIEESKYHLNEDYKVLEREGIENIIKEQFIPWLKGEDFKDKDNNKILDGLKVYAITYEYSWITDNASPTKESNYFGQFCFHLESSNEYTSDMLEAVEMEIYVFDGKIIKVKGYDV